jgi:hypothetical protein
VLKENDASYDNAVADKRSRSDRYMKAVVLWARRPLWAEPSAAGLGVNSLKSVISLFLYTSIVDFHVSTV